MMKNIIRKIALLSLSVLFPAFFSNLSAAEHSRGTEGRRSETMRVINYNVLEGMKSDASEGYRNFTAWVKEYDPDILALEETNGITEEQLKALAAGWGHPYVVTNCNYPGASTYPVAITSRYEIKDIQHIVGDVHHGGISAHINGIDVLVLHLYPFSVLKKKIRWSDPADLDGDGDQDGDDFRIHEISVYTDAVARLGRKDVPFLMMGDFNSRSPLDADHYSSYDGVQSYTVHQSILEDFNDLLKFKHKEWVRTHPSIYAGWKPGSKEYRIDFIYGSKNIKKRDVLKADVIHDDFTESHSDHYPIVLDLKVRRK